MDSSFREQASDTQKAPKSFLASLRSFAWLTQWLAGAFQMTEEEQEDAGIYLDRLGGE